MIISFGVFKVFIDEVLTWFTVLQYLSPISSTQVTKIPNLAATAYYVFVLVLSSKIKKFGSWWEKKRDEKVSSGLVEGWRWMKNDWANDVC